MTFLQPALLLGLPAVLLPILIHLLNRLRYKSVPWAAMMFLVSAARSSTRHARIRHYLILLFRSLIILFLILALSRPMMGGWIGNTLSGAPDTILVLLDRSASMETTDPRVQSPKRAHALQRFVQAASVMQGESRYVLVENVLNRPQEVAGAAALPAISLTEATDTAADIPSMIAAALDYLDANPVGRAEIWLASDLQASNWRPDDGIWTELAGRMATQATELRLRLLAMTTPARDNVAVTLDGLKRQVISGTPHLNLSVALARTPEATRAFPVSMSLNGARLPDERTLDPDAGHYSRLLPLPETMQEDGWGHVDIPADDNPRDNACFFVYDEETQLHTAVVADDSDAMRFLQLAAAPAPQWFPHSAESLMPSQTPTLNTEELSLLIWQSGSGADDILGTVETFATAGGAVLCFPPSDATARRGPFGLAWRDVETSPSESPMRVATWDDRDGPLARSRDGVGLPVGGLTIVRRRLPLLPGDADTADATSDAPSDWIPMATYADETPFLLKRRVGAGSVFVCTTLPHPDWSTLGEGFVLVPMVQRILKEGGARLSEKGIEACGVWQPDEDDPWTALGHDGNIRWNAGVYTLGARRVALNRPALEDDPTPVSLADARRLFGAADVRVFEETADTARRETSSELWPFLLLLAVLCMMVESGLLISDRLAKQKLRSRSP